MPSFNLSYKGVESSEKKNKKKQKKIMVFCAQLFQHKISNNQEDKRKMACFPRLFHRQKNSFNPAEDDNKDTMMNSNENSVQIGRYVRREETSIFTPKSSEHSIHQNRTTFRQSSIQAQGGSFNSLENNNKAISNNGNKFPNNVGNGHKKFISHKSGYGSNTSSFNNKHNNNISYQSNANQSQHSKYKPVKERRPTALPSEVPPVDVADDDDDDDDNSHTDNNNKAADEANKAYDATDGVHNEPDAATGALKKLPNTIFDRNEAYNEVATNDNINSAHTTPVQGVKFFIGLQDGDADSLDAHSRISAKSNNLKQIKQTSTNANEVSESSRYSTAVTPATPSPLPTPTLTPRPTPRPKFSRQTSAESNSRAGHGGGGSTPKHVARAKFPSNTSNTSIHKQHIRKSRSDAPEEVEPVFYIPPPPPLPPQPLTTAASSASIASLIISRAKRNSPTKQQQQSPLKDNDQSTTHKDSDSSSSTKSHRAEGGLIFTRPNLPEKKDVEIPVIEKDEKTRTLIRNAIEKNDFLNNYMDKERKEMVIDAMEPATYEQHSFIINENEEGSEIFVSEDGYFDVIKAGKVIGELGPATVFGELAILYNAKRFASIQAKTYARVWKIDRETFRNIMIISGSRERQENLNFLRSAPFLKDLGEEVLDRVVDLLQRKFYETNTCIVREGEVGNDFFIIRGGTVTIKKKNEYDVERVVDRRKRGDYFGEQALLNADRRQASVYADAPGTECLKLEREAFISYLGTIPQLREKPVDREFEARVSDKKSEFDNKYANVQLADLTRIATLGAGAFGRVDLVAHNGETFALKIIKKIDVIKQDQVEHVYSEKHVMMKCSSSPFIIELYKTFRNDKFVYFLMEACMGGDVWTIMSQRRFFDEKTARFIAGCVVEAFDFLHSHHIIYRDLKPENLMLTTDGYCKLVDFGFAKHVPPNQKTNTFAGTPEYVAPEIILDRGHDRSVDYWALGILIFELLVGKTPFRGQNQIKIYQQILGGIDVIQMPSKIPKSAQGLIKHLCKQLPAERLGYQRKGILDIKRHSWFDGLDWAKLKTKQLTSPVKRPITSNTDIQYFGPCGTEHDHDPPDETSGWDIDF